MIGVTAFLPYDHTVPSSPGAHALGQEREGYADTHLGRLLTKQCMLAFKDNNASFFPYDYTTPSSPWFTRPGVAKRRLRQHPSRYTVNKAMYGMLAISDNDVFLPLRPFISFLTLVYEPRGSKERVTSTPTPVYC